MNILICGAGALGSSLAQVLVPDLKGEHQISVLDMDIVETRNIEAGTQFYMPGQEDSQKTEALEYNIYKWFQRNIIPLHGMLVRKGTPGRAYDFSTIMLNAYNLVIDCFDNQDARQILQDWHVATKGQLLHAGFSDQFTFAVEWAEHYQVPTDITSGFDICQTQGAASFVKMVGACTSMVVQEYVNNKKKIELIGNKLSVRRIE